MDSYVKKTIEAFVSIPNFIDYPEGSIFFRGGETDLNSVSLRNSNIFLSITGMTSETYSNFWMWKANSYIYRASSIGDIHTISIDKQGELCSLLSKHLSYKENPMFFQRDELLQLCRDAFDSKIDGITYKDEDRTEVIIDNEYNVLNLEDFCVFRRGHPDRNAIDRVLMHNI